MLFIRVIFWDILDASSPSRSRTNRNTAQGNSTDIVSSLYEKDRLRNERLKKQRKDREVLCFFSF